MNILLLEDNAGLAKPLVGFLQKEQYSVRWVNSLDDAFAALAEQEPDLLILDIMLPGNDDAGFTLASELRSIGFTGKVLFLSARDEVSDKVHGLDIGGDDYLVKPFSMLELVARVRSLLRRDASTKNTIFRRGRLEIHYTNQRVLWQGQEIKLSEKEWQLLELFSLYPEKKFTTHELLERCFPNSPSGIHNLRVYIGHLRKKISPDIVTTLAGGYRLGLASSL